jgi:hypothetical protein
MEGERLLIGAELRDLDDRAPMSTKRIDKLVRYIDKLRALESKPVKATRAWLDARKKDEASLRAARGRLVETGISEERLARFPAEQVLLLDEKLAYEVARDDAMKLMNLPSWQLEKLAAEIKRPKDAGLFGFLVPALTKVRRAQGRLEQRLALLRHVEALRLYAAAHEGKLPAKLSDCPVPLPADPFTDKPFRYEVKGDTFHLWGTPPPGEAKNPAYNVHYQVTIRK